MKRLWLTRDNSKISPYYLWSRKPCFTDRWASKFFLHTFCIEDFERITGIKMKPGEIRRVKKITFELEEKTQ